MLRQSRRIDVFVGVMMTIIMLFCAWAWTWAGEVRTAMEFTEDFDQPGRLKDRWQAAGPLEATRVQVGVSADNGVGGQALKVKTKASGSIVSLVSAKPLDFCSCDRLILRAKAEAVDPKTPMVMEIRFTGSKGPGSLWQKIQVDSSSWKRYEIPLRDFVENGVTCLTWEDANRVGFYFRNSGVVFLDGIEIARGSRPNAALTSIEQIQQEAFPRQSPRLFRRGSFVVITDSTTWDGKGLLESLELMSKQFHEDFPIAQKPKHPIPLLIFTKEQSYRSYWPEHAKRMGFRMAKPLSDGFSRSGVASSFLDPDDPQRIRPVFVHEANHALVYQALGLANVGDWFLEGVATRYQLNLLPPEERLRLRGLVKTSNRRLSLKVLTNGENIGIDHYSEAIAFVDWLLDDPRRKQGFQQAIRLMKQAGSTNLTPIAKTCFQKDVEQLEEQWLAWLAK